MASSSIVVPSIDFRKELEKRGGLSVSRCYQCATCSSVCELAPEGAPFPRRQMVRAQWGLGNHLASDPALWLCHQCNDCTNRCPRDAKPGDVMQALRSVITEKLAFPGFLGALVGKARITWPLLVGLPFLFWIGFIYWQSGFAIPDFNEAGEIVWDKLVPHWMIYVTFFPVTAWVLLSMFVSAKRYWTLMGQGVKRRGSFIENLVPTIVEILAHKRFDNCKTTSRKTGHLVFFWGYVGAAITTALVVLAMYGWNAPLPLPQTHPFKWIGNVSAVLLILGGAVLVGARLKGGVAVGTATAFDIFFLSIAVLVGLTGAMTEVGRLLAEESLISVELASWIYVSHLSFILCLFATFPYSKLAHMVYRTLAMVHEKMVKTA